MMAATYLRGESHGSQSESLDRYRVFYPGTGYHCLFERLNYSNSCRRFYTDIASYANIKTFTNIGTFSGAAADRYYTATDAGLGRPLE
jgi:hypothetical protein